MPATRSRSPPRPRSSSGSTASASPRSGRATARSTRSTWPLRRALNGRYPALDRIHLTDFKVRVLDGGATPDAVVRVLIDSTDGERRVDHDRRVDTNVIEASWQALIDSLVYGLLHSGQ